jgi:hypothetical protein
MLRCSSSSPRTANGVRDRIQIAQGLEVEARQRSTTDYLAVELAALRFAQNEAATRDYIDRTLSRQLEALRAQIRGDF